MHEYILHLYKFFRQIDQGQPRLEASLSRAHEKPTVTARVRAIVAHSDVFQECNVIIDHHAVVGSGEDEKMYYRIT